MMLTEEQIQKLKDVRKNLVIHTIEKSSDENELPIIRFHGDQAIINAFYLFTRNRKSDWWLENYEILETIMNHLRANLNRRKLKESDKND